MSIRVKYFASLETDQPLSVAEVWSRLWPDTPLPPHVLTAVNMEYTDLNHPVRDNDEVAFFPPVTGG